MDTALGRYDLVETDAPSARIVAFEGAGGERFAIELMFKRTFLPTDADVIARRHAREVRGLAAAQVAERHYEEASAYLMGLPDSSYADYMDPRLYDEDDMAQTRRETIRKLGDAMDWTSDAYQAAKSFDRDMGMGADIGLVRLMERLLPEVDALAADAALAVQAAEAMQKEARGRSLTTRRLVDAWRAGLDLPAPGM